MLEFKLFDAWISTKTLNVIARIYRIVVILGLIGLMLSAGILKLQKQYHGHVQSAEYAQGTSLNQDRVTTGGIFVFGLDYYLDPKTHRYFKIFTDYFPFLTLICIGVILLALKCRIYLNFSHKRSSMGAQESLKDGSVEAQDVLHAAAKEDSPAGAPVKWVGYASSSPVLSDERSQEHLNTPVNHGSGQWGVFKILCRDTAVICILVLTVILAYLLVMLLEGLLGGFSGPFFVRSSSLEVFVTRLVEISIGLVCLVIVSWSVKKLIGNKKDFSVVPVSDPSALPLTKGRRCLNGLLAFLTLLLLSLGVVDLGVFGLVLIVWFLQSHILRPGVAASVLRPSFLLCIFYLICLSVYCFFIKLWLPGYF